MGKVVFSGLFILSLVGLFEVCVIDVNDMQGVLCRPLKQEPPGLVNSTYQCEYYTYLLYLFIYDIQNLKNSYCCLSG
jgi:hypothetical protein